MSDRLVEEARRLRDDAINGRDDLPLAHALLAQLKAAEMRELFADRKRHEAERREDELQGWASVGRTGECVHSKTEPECAGCQIRVLRGRVDELREKLAIALRAELSSDRLKAEVERERDELRAALDGAKTHARAMLNAQEKLFEALALAERDSTERKR